MRRPSRQARRNRSWVLAISLAAGLTAFIPPAAPAVQVELELVLALDVSASVDAGEYKLQIEGVGIAFRDPEVISAIESLGGKGIAVALVQWDEEARSQVSIPFHHVSDARSAKAFGFLVGLAPRKAKTGSTAIGSAIQFGAALLEGNAYEASRRIIDISGDGRANAEPYPEPWRDLAVAQGLTINGLAILTDDRTLAAYYRSSVIGGRGAFVVSAADYPAFAAAFRQKLLREILPPLSLAPDRTMNAAVHQTGSLP